MGGDRVAPTGRYEPWPRGFVSALQGFRPFAPTVTQGVAGVALGWRVSALQAGRQPAWTPGLTASDVAGPLTRVPRQTENDALPTVVNPWE